MINTSSSQHVRQMANSARLSCSLWAFPSSPTRQSHCTALRYTRCGHFCTPLFGRWPSGDSGGHRLTLLPVTPAGAAVSPRTLRKMAAPITITEEPGGHIRGAGNNNTGRIVTPPWEIAQECCCVVEECCQFRVCKIHSEDSATPKCII